MRDVITLLFDHFETLDAFGPAEIPRRLTENFALAFSSLAKGANIF